MHSAVQAACPMDRDPMPVVDRARQQLDAEMEMLRLQGALRAIGRLMGHLGGPGTDPEGEDLRLLMDVVTAQADVVKEAYDHAR